MLTDVGRDGHGQATLVLLQLWNEFMAVENMELLEHVQRRLAEIRGGKDFPKGLERGMTRLGGRRRRHALRGQREHPQHGVDHRGPGRADPAVGLWQGPGLVIVPLVAIFASLALSTGLIALLAQAGADGRLVRLQGLPHHEDLHRRRALRRGNQAIASFSSRGTARELTHGLPPRRALRLALASVGPAVTTSAMTTILGLGTMIFAAFGKFRYGGPTIALSLAVALLACLTLAPALLLAGGRIVFWPFCLPPCTPSAPASIPAALWQAIGHAVVTRPGLIFVGCLLVMAWPAYEALSVSITYDLVAELSPQRPSVQGTNLLRRYFSPARSRCWSARQPGFQTEEGRNDISRLTRVLSDLAYVDSHGGRSGPSRRSAASPIRWAIRPAASPPFPTLGGER